MRLRSILHGAVLALVATGVAAPIASVQPARAHADLSNPFADIHQPCIDCSRDGPRKPKGNGVRPPKVPPRIDRITVDCSGLTLGAASTVQEALGKVDANGTIVILPPGRGVTCYGTIDVRKPVTIRSADGGGPAVLEAPLGEACLIARVHLGDALIMENITFIARGLHEPCVQVRAGAVILRNARVDSRNTDWAFDVADSGILTVENSRVETDGNGIHARRAEIHLKGFEVDVEEGYLGIGLALDRTEGTVEGSNFIGGNIGILASAGVRNLEISDSTVRKTHNAMHLVPGQQGLIDIARVDLLDNIDGLVVAPSTDTMISDLSVKNSAGTAIAVYGGAMRLKHNTVDRAAVGILVGTGDHYPRPHVQREIEEILGYRQAAEIVERRPASITDNTIRRTGLGLSIDRRAGAEVTGNTIEKSRRCATGLGWWRSAGHNTCID